MPYVTDSQAPTATMSIQGFPQTDPFRGMGHPHPLPTSSSGSFPLPLPSTAVRYKRGGNNTPGAGVGRRRGPAGSRPGLWGWHTWAGPTRIHGAGPPWAGNVVGQGLDRTRKEVPLKFDYLDTQGRGPGGGGQGRIFRNQEISRRSRWQFLGWEQRMPS